MINTAEKLERRWLAELKLGFESDGRRTILSERKHYGPLIMQKPFYPEGDVCHVYLIHPPGGVVGGDELNLTVNVNKQAHALITTPAATKFYRGNSFQAKQIQTINVASGCKMEWLPQETIFFSGCEANTSTIVNLEGDAQFIGWEIICLGRPASQEFFDKGYYRQQVEVWRDNKPIIIERSRLQGGDDLLTATWGLQGYVVTGTMIITAANKTVLDKVRENIEQQNSSNLKDESLKAVKLSSTLINDVLICRVLADQAEAARESFISIWKTLRTDTMQCSAVAPRIWYT
jgi:urease accessory protein